MLQLVTLIFPKLQSFGVTLCNVKKTMSERQWSVYKKDFSTGQRQCLKDNGLYIKKMLQLVTLIFPELQSFGVTLCNVKKTMWVRQCE